jgi:hypothetical protein
VLTLAECEARAGLLTRDNQRHLVAFLNDCVSAVKAGPMMTASNA